MTLYDIKITQQDSFEGSGFQVLRWGHPNVRLTVEITPWVPMIVPAGSTLIVNRDEGPEAHLTGPNLGLVTRGDVYHTKSKIVDGSVMHELADESARYLARQKEDLVVEALREFATRQIEGMK